MKYFYLLSSILLLLFLSCSNTENSQQIDSETVETIRVDMEKESFIGNFDDYFDSMKVISLETNEKSLLGRIERISLYQDKIFILDTSTNSVLVFNNKGKFLFRLQNVGNGPKEYDSLMDFAIDRKNEQIILYADRPYRFYFYDLEGNFIKTKSTNKFFFHIAFQNDNLIKLNVSGENFILSEYNLKTEERKGFLPMTEMYKMFASYRFEYPKVNKDENIHITFPYSNFVYEYTENGVSPKYYIDFGENKVPEKVLKRIIGKEKKYFSDVRNYARKNNYGWGICNFRENKNYVIFTFDSINLVVYSKKTKKAKRFSHFSKNRVPFYKYFVHNGNDNKLVSIYEADQFRKHTRQVMKKEDLWKKRPEYLKKMYDEVSDDSNPLLVIYTFKE